jgi:hypothetical protein
MQTVMLFLLFMKIDAFEDRLDVSGKSGVQTKEGAVVTVIPKQGEMVATQTGLDSRQLRQIIREELREIARSDELQVQTSTQEPETPVYDETEMQYRQELVLEEMDLLKQQVDVSSGELESLLGDIARLDPEARSEMLRNLNQAINRGEINGRL